MLKKDLAKYLKVDLSILNNEIMEKVEFYGVHDFDESDKIFVYLLAKIRELNSDEFNMYKMGNTYYINYKDDEVKIVEDNDFLENFFNFLIKNKLRYY